MGSVKAGGLAAGADGLGEGKGVGTPPWEAKDLPAGKHAVKLVPATNSGMAEWTQDVEVRPGELQAVDATLVPVATVQESAPAAVISVHTARVAHVPARTQGQVAGLHISV